MVQVPSTPDTTDTLLRRILGGALVVALLIFVGLTIVQYLVINDVIDLYRAAEGGEEKIATVIGSLDKTLSTLIGFVTAVVTGVLGYLGGAQGKADVKKEADKAKDQAEQATAALNAKLRNDALTADDLVTQYGIRL